MSHNTAITNGGGLYVHTGSAALSGARITDNGARSGGGLYVYTGTATLERVAVAGNQAAWDGGGAYNEGGTLTLVNTTVSGNDSAVGTGGLFNGIGTTLLTYTTVVSNTGTGPARGIGNMDGLVVLQNTIVAFNGTLNCWGWLDSNGHNLDGDDTCSLGATGDITSTDPLLDPLVEERGTLVHPLLEGSPAIDAGACLPGVTTVDQRGVARSASCDIGAYEWWFVVRLPLVLRSYP